MIENVNNIHRGTYGCTAKSADGQVAQSHTKLEVVGPDIDDVMTKCAEAVASRTCVKNALYQLSAPWFSYEGGTD